MIRHYLTTVVYLGGKQHRSDVIIEEYDVHEYIRRKKQSGKQRQTIYMEFNAPVNGEFYARSWEYVGNNKWNDEEKRLLDASGIPYYEYNNGLITEKNSPLKSK